VKGTSKRYIYAAVIIIVVASASIGTYYWFSRTPEKLPKLMTLRVGHLLADQLHQPGWVVAKEMGYFAEEGFEVIHSEYINGPEEMTHFAAGELDVAYVGAAPFLSARAGGIDIIAVASSNTEGSSLVVSNQTKTVGDLDGTIIGSPGIGTIQDYMLTRIEEQHGIQFEHFYARITDLIVYFQTKEIDGYIAWEPHATRAVVDGIRGAHLLLNSSGILPGHQCCVLAVRGDWVREAPHIVRRIVRWHMKAHKWVLEHPNEAEAIIADSSGLSTDLVKTAHPIVKHPYPPYVHSASCEIMTEGLIATNKIKNETVPNVQKFVNESIDNSFVRDLDEELKPPASTTLYHTVDLPLIAEISVSLSTAKTIIKFQRGCGKVEN